MNQDTDALDVRLYGRRAGELRKEKDGTLSFAYDGAYAESDAPVPISLSMPVRKTRYGSEPTTTWFGGLLPEGANLEALAELCETEDKDPWTLLGIAGAECAGAVQIVHPEYRDAPTFEQIDEGTVAEMLKEYANNAPQRLLRAARLSLLAGAQYKIALHRDETGQWSVATGGAPTTHILKPQSRHREIGQLVENEHWCMRMAHYAGIETAQVEITTIGGETALVVERYDRVRDKHGQLHRYHQEDLAQALATREKYHQDGGPDATMLAEAAGRDRDALFERMVFQWIIGNCDAHAKNYALLEPGTARARLSPAYDLVSTASYPRLDLTLAIPIGRAEELYAVDAGAVTELGARMDLDAEEAAARTQDLARRCRDALDECADNAVALGPVSRTRINARIRTALTWWQKTGDTGPKRAPAPENTQAPAPTSSRPRGLWD